MPSSASHSLRSPSATRCWPRSSPSSTDCGPSPTAGRSRASTGRCVARRGTARSPAAVAATRTIILGGKGLPRLAALVARYGDEFNLNSASPDDATARLSARRDACKEIGRDPDELVYSAMTGVLVAETEGDLRTRVGDLMQAPRPRRRRRRGLARRASRALDHGHARRGARTSCGARAAGDPAHHAAGLPAARPRPRSADGAHLRDLTARAGNRRSCATLPRSGTGPTLTDQRLIDARATRARATPPIPGSNAWGSRNA